MSNAHVSVPGAEAFLKGLPWVALIPVFAFVSWKGWALVLQSFMPADVAGLVSIGISTMGAYAICMIAMAGNWPLTGISSFWARGIAIIILAKAMGAAFFIILHSCFHVDLTVWAFPIIATSWLVISVTSFVGGDAHLPGIPPLRQVLLNLLISVGMTLLLIRTIGIFPAFWFPFLQVTIVTGGLAYLFRRVKQPAYSVLVWSLLMLLMFVLFAVAQYFGHFTLNVGQPSGWAWNLGSGTPEFGLFIAWACGMNLGVLGCTQCWPFCRIRQPWGTAVATCAVLGWCCLLAVASAAFFRTLVPAEAAVGEATVMAWHTVFWGFAWIYCFGVGQKPYLWAGQKTPGTWDDVE